MQNKILYIYSICDVPHPECIIGDMLRKDTDIVALGIDDENHDTVEEMCDIIEHVLSPIDHIVPLVILSGFEHETTEQFVEFLSEFRAKNIITVEQGMNYYDGNCHEHYVERTTWYQPPQVFKKLTKYDEDHVRDIKYDVNYIAFINIVDQIFTAFESKASRPMSSGGGKTIRVDSVATLEGIGAQLSIYDKYGVTPKLPHST